MTVQEVVDRVDSVKPNDYKNQDKVAWLNELEGRVQTEIYLNRIEEVKPLETVGDTLCVPFPYDAMYVYYLQAMIDFQNNEYDRYENTYEVFNKKWKEYEKWYSTHYPTRGRVAFGVTEVTNK